jgi:hypothetical protein
MVRPEDAAVLTAFGETVEAAARQVESKWGMGRLERLAALGDAALFARFRRQQATWSFAYQAAWEAQVMTRDLLTMVEDKAAAMTRAWWALDAWAEQAGHRSIAPWVWEVWLADGSVAALVEDDAAASKVIAEGRFVSVYTAKEVGALIDALPGALQMAKATWTGAKFQGPQIGNKLGASAEWVEDGDDIPFGDPEPKKSPADPEPEISAPVVVAAQLNDWREDFA